jgi:hypothetical protein
MGKTSKMISCVLNDRFIPVSFCVSTLKFDKILLVLVVQYR